MFPMNENEPMKRKPINPTAPTCIEICSGAGGQALELEMAGFEAVAHVENGRHACATLRQIAEVIAKSKPKD